MEKPVIMITGAGGNLGSAVVRSLLEGARAWHASMKSENARYAFWQAFHRTRTCLVLTGSI